MQHQDPFTGTWTFDAERSTLSAFAPKSWTQRITATMEDISVREESVADDGFRTTHSLQARFDGQEYPVHGSPVADTISYTRLDPHNIVGTGRKDGLVSLEETITVSETGSFLTLRFVIYRLGRQVASGVAVLEKAQSVD
jgi:hypothetical protein